MIYIIDLHLRTVISSTGASLTVSTSIEFLITIGMNMLAKICFGILTGLRLRRFRVIALFT